MDMLHRVVSPGLFYAAAGVNVCVGTSLLLKPLPKDEILSKFAQKFGGDAKKAEADMAVLKGTELQIAGKGVVLIGLGGLLLAAMRSKDKTFLNSVVAVIAAGDVALLALWAAQHRKNPAFLSLDSERAVMPASLAYAAAEAVAFGAYLWSCTKH